MKTLNKQRMDPSRNLLDALSVSQVNTWCSEGKARLVALEEGELVYQAGDPCTGIDLIQEGEIAVEKLDEEGRLTRISQFGSGELFGANLIFSDFQRYPFSVTAIRPTKLLRLDPEALLQLAMRDKTILRSLLYGISAKSFVLSQGIDYLTGKTVEDKIMIYVKQNLSHGQRHLTLNLTKKSLAAYLDVSRTSLSRTLSQMKASGRIDYDRHSITLLEKDPPE